MYRSFYQKREDFSGYSLANYIVNYLCIQKFAQVVFFQDCLRKHAVIHRTVHTI